MQFMASKKIRRWTMFSVVIVVIGSASLFACNGNRDGTRPPNATITAMGQSVLVHPGSYCWGGLCVDGVPNLDQAVSVRLARGEPMTLRTSALSHARAVAASWRSVDRADAGGQLGVQRNGEWAMLLSEFANGRWEVDVLVSASGGGDVAYTFIVDAH